MADISPDLHKKLVERFPGHTWALSIPEIADLLVRATNEEWSPELFESHLRSTNWWRTVEPAVREWTQLQATDPAAAQARIEQQRQRVVQLVAELGFTGEIHHGASNHIAYLSLSQGWTEQRLRQVVADTWGPQPGTFTNVRALAQRYMVHLNDAEASDYTRRLFTGELSEQGLVGLFRQRALARFPHLADLINSGATPADFFADYVSMISEYTDTPASQIDLSRDPTWSRILSYNDPQSGQVRPMTFSEAMRYVRGTDQFAQSRRGRQETASFVDAITTALGTRR